MNEPDTILQPSLHTMEEYANMVFDEAECRDIDVSDLRAESDPEWVSERIDDALGRISDAGYPLVEENDTLLIWGKGTKIPAEWSE